MTVHPLARFIEHVEERPSAIAIVDGVDRISYGQLAARTAGLAARLRRAGVEPGDRVAVFVPKSSDAVAAFLACLSVGAPYVPVDLASPPARAARMMSVARPAAIVAGDRGHQLVEAVTGRLEGLDEPVVDIGDVTVETAGVDLSVPADEGLAHLLFTSGSTGMPKAVAVSIANVAHFVEWATDHFGIEPGDRISGHAPFHFDLSTFDIFGALTTGAELHLVSGSLNLLPHKLSEWIREQALTQWFSVPTVLTQLVENGDLQADDFPRLRQLLWCGEAISTPVLRQLMELLPHVSFTNLYGPTETTVASSFHQVHTRPATDQEPIPIGTAIPGEALSIRDEAGATLPPGARGEICIAGAGVTHGYWSDPERTDAAFIDHGRYYRTGDVGHHDEHGRFFVLGRRDNQIKFRGHRIELGEIEAGLHALPDVVQAAVVFPQGKRPTITAAVVLASGAEIRDLRSTLGAALPNYMVPGRWEVVDALPTNANGKIDRNLIRSWFETEPTT